MTTFDFSPIDAFDDYVDVGEMEKGERKFVLKLEDGFDLKLKDDDKHKLFGAMNRAFNLSLDITGRDLYDSYWQDSVNLYITENMGQAAMNNAFAIQGRYAMDMSEETLSASMLHELIEMEREDRGLIGEGVPLMVEFLFCGDDRDSLFLRMSSELGGDSHDVGWWRMMNHFGYVKDDKVDFDGLKKWKNGLSEDQKINFVKENLIDLDENDTGN